MHIVLANTTAHSGGAARAAQRLYQALNHLQEQIDFCSLYEQEQPTPFQETIPHKIERLATKIVTQKSASYYAFSPVNRWLPGLRQGKPRPDIIHLHWTNGFMSLYQLRALAQQNPGQKFIWTLHDMALFTGGCHYDQLCGKYQESCQQCPMLKRGFKGLAHRQWRQKQSLLSQIDLTVITPSQWLAEAVQSSTLLSNTPIHVIPNAIDTKIYKPMDQDNARQFFDLPITGKVILVGAVNVEEDPRKGLDLLQSALKHSALQNFDDLRVLVLGGQKTGQTTIGTIPVHYTGFLQDDVRLCQAFNAADTTVVPSRQENLANMLTESLSCGTAVAGFDIGGNSDLIQHRQTGWLSPGFDTEHLANGLAAILTESTTSYAENARKLAEEQLSLKHIGERHRALYQECLSTQNTANPSRAYTNKQG